jgi:hypothetical protein
VAGCLENIDIIWNCEQSLFNSVQNTVVLKNKKEEKNFFFPKFYDLLSKFEQNNFLPSNFD